MRHEGEDSSAESLNTRDTLRGAVGVVRVSFGGLVRRVDVSNGDGGSGGFGGRGREESCSTFTVSDGDGERRADHLAQEDGRLGSGRVDNLNLSESSFESTGKVLLEEWPVFGSGNDFSELREELTTVADSEGEGVLSIVEELGELLASTIVKEDRFRPTVSSSQHITV